MGTCLASSAWLSWGRWDRRLVFNDVSLEARERYDPFWWIEGSWEVLNKREW